MTEIRVPEFTGDSPYLLIDWLVHNGRPVRPGEAVATVETSQAIEILHADSAGVLQQFLKSGAPCTPGQVIGHLDASANGGNPRTHHTPAPAIAAQDGHSRTAAGGPQPRGTRTSPAKGVRGPNPTRSATGGTEGTAGSGLGASSHDSKGPHGDGAGARATRPGLSAGSHDGRGAYGDGAGPGVAGPGLDGAGLDGDGPRGDGAGPGDGVRGNVANGANGDRGELYELTAAQQGLHAAVTASQQTIPAAFAAVTVDCGAARQVGRELSTRLQTPVGLPELLIAAAAARHRDFPLFFASLVDERTARLAPRPDIGVTIDVGKGLFIPVVRDAAARGIKEIAQAIMAFRLTALRGSFATEDLAGANLTVALHTDDDVVMAVPLVYPGQSCTLSLSATRREFVPGGEGAIIARSVATLGISYDHRLVTGRAAAVFLNEIRETLESPARLTG